MFYRLVRWVRATAAYLDAVDPAAVPAGIPVIDITQWRWRLFTGTSLDKMARLDEVIAPAFIYNAPASGATITLSAGDRALVIDPAAAIAALNIVLPPSPINGDVFELSASQAITAIAVTAPPGVSVNGGGGALAANGGMSWRYRAANTTWYRRY